MPRVLHVLEAIETGCARHLTDLVTHATSTEHHVAVPGERHGGHTDQAGLAAMAAAGATIHRVEMRRAVASARNALAVPAVHRLARRLDVDVVHGHSSIGGVVARAAAVGTGAAAVYTPNGLATGALPSVVERLLRRRTTRFVAVSASEARDAQQRGFAGPAQVVVIANGIAPEAPGSASLRELAGIPAGVPLVGSLGRLVPQKAPEVLVQAWARVAEAVPDAWFVLIGDGDARQAQAVDETFDRLPLAGRSRRLPFVPDAARYLGDLDVFVLTSRFEGGPYAPLEAMRAGTAVVLTDVVGSRDAVDPGRTGILTPAEDPGATAAAVIALLRDRDERDRLAEAGRTAVTRTNTVAEMGRAYDALYADLAASQPRRGRAQAAT